MAADSEDGGAMTLVIVVCFIVIVPLLASKIHSLSKRPDASRFVRALEKIRRCLSYEGIDD